MGNEQKQEYLNNQNIQEQEPKQMMPYVDNQIEYNLNKDNF